MIARPLEVVDICDRNLPQAKLFLERYPDTSLFLLSNIRAFGTRLGESLYSGNLKGLLEDGQLRALFCLTRGGNLLAQTAGDARHARQILDACAGEPQPIRGVLGEWNITTALWDQLVRGGRINPTFISKEVSYRLGLTKQRSLDVGTPVEIRMLTLDDNDQWEIVEALFRKESGLPEPGTREQRRSAFERSTRLCHWWGAFNGRRLVSLAAIIALHETSAQVGSVFTVPDYRRRGLSRAIMTRLIRDSRDEQGIEWLFLFTGEENSAARSLYESLGFESAGYFGLFFGDPA